jgi:hypothetical protein
MRSRSCALTLALLCGVPTAQAGEIIERVLAVVDDTPILLSEVAALERLRRLDRESALSARIDEALMLREAQRLSEAGVSPADEERGLTSLRKATDAETAAAIGEPELRHIARRQTAILKYIEFRFRPQVRIEEEEVRKLYAERYAAREPAPVFEAVAAELAAELEKRALDLRVEQWIGDLRAAARIRRNAQPS